MKSNPTRLTLSTTLNKLGFRIDELSHIAICSMQVTFPSIELCHPLNTMIEVGSRNLTLNKVKLSWNIAGTAPLLTALPRIDPLKA